MYAARGVIEEANAQPGLDTINFDLPPDSLIIQPASPLPDISEAAIVDASTEPGPERSEAAIVDGSAQPSATCLTPTVQIDGAVDERLDRRPDHQRRRHHSAWPDHHAF